MRRILLGCILSFFIPIIACSAANARHIQGATIAGNYFIYADVTNYGAKNCGNSWETTGSCVVDIYRCNLNIKNCKKIVSGAKLGHANALDYNWSTGYFAVYNGWCDPSGSSKRAKECFEGCYNLKGQSNKSKCTEKAHNNTSHACSRTQGFSEYKSGKNTYSLKGSDACNGQNSGKGKIDIFKNNKYQTSIYVPLHGGELEDVMVDKNGNIYYTTVSSGKVHLHKAGKKLPAPSSKSSSQESKVKRVFRRKSSDKNKTTPVESTYDGSVDTVLFGKIQEDGDGCSVFNVLDFIIEILTYGIGIAAVIGISISGIIYLTAKGDEAQTTKAKKRIYEIVIGLAIYAVLWALLNWLLPGGALNNQCKDTASQADSSSQVASSHS